MLPDISVFRFDFREICLPAIVTEPLINQEYSFPIQQYLCNYFSTILFNHARNIKPEITHQVVILLCGSTSPVLIIQNPLQANWFFSLGRWGYQSWRSWQYSLSVYLSLLYNLRVRFFIIQRNGSFFSIVSDYYLPWIDLNNNIAIMNHLMMKKAGDQHVICSIFSLQG